MNDKTMPPRLFTPRKLLFAMIGMGVVGLFASTAAHLADLAFPLPKYTEPEMVARQLADIPTVAWFRDHPTERALTRDACVQNDPRMAGLYEVACGRALEAAQ